MFHLKHFSSATNNLKVLPYWNISYVKIMTYGYRDDSFILPLQVQDTHFFSCYVTFTNCIIKQFTNSISESLSKKFSNQEIFNTAKVEYKDVLNKSGYNAELKLQEESRICKWRELSKEWYSLWFRRNKTIIKKVYHWLTKREL